MELVNGQFGGTTKRKWSCTYGLNEQGGMNDNEFEEYCLKI